MSKRRVQGLGDLPRDIPPARDLWPAIAEAIQADLATKAVPDARRRVGWWPVAGLAASVALVALGVFIGQNFKPEQAGPELAHTVVPATETNANSNANMIKASVRQAEYRKQRDHLWTEVQARLATMPPAEREKVGASLATLKKSIQEIEDALGRDPANALLQELLVNSCQEEMRVLTTVRDSGRQEL
jgi:N-acyl-D-aspartate/D-glutamate deacylase